MGSGDWTADQSERTAPYLQDYPGYVVAYDGDCRRFRDREVDPDQAPNKNRNFIPLSPDELEEDDLEDLWYMGILVCPEEDVAAIAKRVAELGKEIGRDRVGLYLAPGVEEIEVIEAWKQAGIGPPPGVYHFDHDEEPWRDFHNLFGEHHAEQVDEDQRRFSNHIEKYRRSQD